MRFIIGLVIVFGCVLGAFMGMGGNLIALYQPGELVIIGGAAVGAFVIANPKSVIFGALRGMKSVFKGLPYDKKAYMELLMFLFEVLKLIRAKGVLAIEGDIDAPDKSELFAKYPKVISDHHSTEFFCDYVRVISMGVESHYQLEDMMLAEIEGHHHEVENVNGAVRDLGDGLPAIGIVAAVLGVIKTMSSISEPPEVLGKLIGGALVGTFLGVLMSYCMVTPMYSFMTKHSSAGGHFMNCIKAALLSHLQGNAPAIAVECARKVIPDNERPSFSEFEEAMNSSN